MPSANELRASGANDLACAIPRCGGFLEWARRLDLARKGTETHRGQSWEKIEADFFRSLGLEVEGQTTRAPFDLLVAGMRVDVKIATYRSYPYKGHTIRGFFFAGLRYGADCDLFDLLCIRDGKIAHRFLIPSDVARVQTLTITESSITGNGLYAKYLDATTF